MRKLMDIVSISVLVIAGICYVDMEVGGIKNIIEWIDEQRN